MIYKHDNTAKNLILSKKQDTYVIIKITMSSTQIPNPSTANDLFFDTPQGQGDIILQSNSSKRSKLIVIIALVGLIIATIIIAILTQNNGKNNATSNGQSSKAQISFNTFAKSIVTENLANIEIDDISPADWTIVKQLQNKEDGESRASYATQLEDAWRTFKYDLGQNSTESEDSNSFHQLVTGDYDSLISAAVSYFQSEETIGEIHETYASSTAEATQEAINSKTNSAGSTLPSVLALYSSLKNYYGAYQNEIAIIKSIGCLKEDDKATADCISSHGGPSSELQDASERVMARLSELDSSAALIIQEIQHQTIPLIKGNKDNHDA